MAGPVTHMMVSQWASSPSKVTTIDEELQFLLLRHWPFLLLGSVGPDLPAIVDAVTPGSHVSDWLHDGKLAPRVPTNTTVRALYDKLKGRNPDCAPFAFLLGWIAHTATDVMVHPIVNDAAKWDSIQHRNCETIQDALLFYEYRQVELKSTDFLVDLRDCKKTPSDLNTTIELWQPIVNEHYGKHDCRKWVESYETAFSIARQVFYIGGYSYPTCAEIKDDDLKRFYSEVTLPVTGRTGNFKTDVFLKAVTVTAQLWQRIYQRFVDPEDKRDIADLVPDWDLNTGENVTTGRTFDLWR